MVPSLRIALSPDSLIFSDRGAWGRGYTYRLHLLAIAVQHVTISFFLFVATILVVIVDMVQASHSVNQMNSMTHLSHAQVSCTYHTSTVLVSRNKKNKRPHVCAKFVIMKGLILRSATS